jgi:hypothetical protein
MNLKNSYWFWFNKAVFGQQPLVSRSKAVSFLINNYAVASTLQMAIKFMLTLSR